MIRSSKGIEKSLADRDVSAVKALAVHCNEKE
jgi:hypothetical protein